MCNVSWRKKLFCNHRCKPSLSFKQMLATQSYYYPFGKTQLYSISCTMLGCKLSPCCINLMQCIPYLVGVLVLMILYVFLKNVYIHYIWHQDWSWDSNAYILYNWCYYCYSLLGQWNKINSHTYTHTHKRKHTLLKNLCVKIKQYH